MIINAVQNVLNDLVEVLKQLTPSQYTASHLELSNATIGEHTRHIVEMFQCLIDSSQNDKVNYDARQRDFLLQTDVSAAIQAVSQICTILPYNDRQVTLIQYFDGTEYRILSNTSRELLYNLEHAIHHQALIKVAILKNENISVSPNFGVARSTIEYRNQCAQ